MVLGRVIRSLGAESQSIVPVKWLTKIFVCGDVASFVIQASGAGVLVTADSMTTGENIIIGGLFVQIVMFGLFALTAAIFHTRLRRHPPRAPLNEQSTWQSTMFMLYVVSAFIMVRSIFRVVEYILGQDGYPLENEWTLYVFDGVLMFGVVVAFGWRFPSGLRPQKIEDVEMETGPSGTESVLTGNK
ncbi:RTA-like protein [Hypoxylon crocopeplum]|nr:RTA-like protein [Hypoxylon crocopeplum]